MSQAKENVRDVLKTEQYFATPIYHIEKPDFIETALAAFEDAIGVVNQDKENELYPSVMTGNMTTDPRMKEFGRYVVGTAWNILKTQGYAMDDKITYFHSMWGQQHYKYGSMEEHIHNDNVQIVGFYFLECPEKGPKMVIHDPRAGKRQVGLAEADMTKVTNASTGIVFSPKPGSLIFANSWLPHSFTRNGSDELSKFIHFNISVGFAPTQQKKAIVV